MKRTLCMLIGLCLLLAACGKQSSSKPKQPDSKAASEAPKSLEGTYQIDTDASYVTFTSAKNHHLPVSGSFGTLSGSISVPGDQSLNQTSGSIELDLTSLDTGVKERDQNILEHFFEAIGDNVVASNVKFKINKMKFRDSVESPLPVNEPAALIAHGDMTLHGTTKKQKLQLTVIRTAPDRILVTTRKPYVFEMETFEMGGPLKKMMEVCGHDAVSKMVPIQLHLTFSKS